MSIPDASVSEHLIDQVPAILWLALAIVVLVWLRREIRERAAAMTGLTLPGGVAFQFAETVGEAAEQRGETVAGGARTRLARRAKRNAEAIHGMQVLWVDDDPASTAKEREALAQVGVDIAVASSSPEALERLRDGAFDLLISDIAREGDAAAGTEFARTLRSNGNGVPVVFYVGQVEPERGVPSPATGITDRPSELVHLVFDCAERRRG